MTIAQLRTYTINKGQLEDWLDVFHSEVVPRMENAGMKVESTWVNQDRSQFIWIRSFGDSYNDVETKEAVFYSSDWWKANVDRVRSYIAHRNVVQIEAA
ncbi:MAG TPA: NIPSNAP family protein [Anaerolineales bacterium]|jgi:hypothetical protein|nr:NIPSNAP family protein [Anaerolineales bacterium]|tara:strand:+ start:2512 stop:2808 length:297 start_codon:yes stop_codon:yes gene_type:complete